jgi:transcriptional regulator with XRE-family HTH domain
MTLNERVRRAREHAGLSIPELARRIDISQPTLWALENTPGRGSKYIAHIAKATGVRWEWLQYGEPPMLPTEAPPEAPAEAQLTPGEKAILEAFRKAKSR